MKLHLPKLLLTAVLAAVAMAPAMGAFTGPTTGYEPGGTITSATTATKDTAYTVHDNSVNVTATGYDIKFSGDDETLLGTIVADTLWIESGRYGADAASDLSGVGKVYVNGASALHFRVSADSTFTSDFSLGTSTYVGSGWTDSNAASIKNSAFIFGFHEDGYKDKTITFSGNVEIQEDARFGFQYGYDAVFNGALTGSGSLGLNHQTGDASTLTLSGNASAYTGAITVGNNVSLTFGGKTDAVAAVTTTNAKGVAGTGNISLSAGGANSKLIFNYSKAADGAYVYITNAISESGNIDGSTLTLKGGADYYFTKTVRVDTINLEAGSLSLKQESGSGAAYAKQAAIKVSAGAKLIATANDALGYNDNATTSVTLTGNSTNAATLELQGRQTMTTELHMDGYAKVTASGSGTNDNQPGLNAFRSNGAVIDVTGTNNEIQAALHTRDSFHITVAEDGALLVSGQVRTVGDTSKGYTSNPHSYEVGSVVKLGAGSLTFTNGDNTFKKTYFNMAGSTVFSHAEGAKATVSHTLERGMQIHAGSVLIDAGAEAVLGKRIDVLSGAQLTINGSIKVDDLTGFDAVMVGGSLSDEVNGYRSAAKEGYLIIDGEAGSTIEKASATYTIAGKTAEDLMWDGNRLLVSTGSAVTASTVYEVNDTTGGAVVYDSSANKWSQATGIQMRDNTTLQLNTALASAVTVSLTGVGASAEILVNGITHDHAKVTTEVGQSVSYNMNGGVLSLSGMQNVNNITSIDMKNGAQVQMHRAANHLGSENAKVQITMSGDSFLSLKNGNSGNVWADITVDGTARIGGGINGNNTNVQGTISGAGTLSLVRSDGTYNNAWTVSSVISDKTGDGQLAVVMNCPDGSSGISQVTLSGNNTYTGGTTITKGKLIASHANALGTGKVVVNGGTLRAATGLNIAELEQTSGSLEFATDTTTIKNGLNAVSVDLTGSTKLVLGVAEGTDTTKSFKIGSTVGGAHLQLHEGKVELGKGTHALGHLDLSNSNKSVAQLTLKKEAVVTTNGDMWLGNKPDVGIILEDKASLKVGNATFVGKGTELATIKRTNTGDDGDKYGIGSSNFTLTNGQFTLTGNVSDGYTELNNKLRNVALVNEATGVLIVKQTDADRDIASIDAKKGNVNLTNMQGIESLVSLDIADAMAVGAHTEYNGIGSTATDFGTISVTESVTLGSGAVVDGNLQLGSVAVKLTTVTTDSSATGNLAEIQGKLLLTLADTPSLTLDTNTMQAIAALGEGETLYILKAGEVDWGTSGAALLADDTAITTPTEIDAALYIAGLNNGYNLNYDTTSGLMGITMSIPEPTTATLSLLALAGLAARRRRK